MTKKVQYNESAGDIFNGKPDVFQNSQEEKEHRHITTKQLEQKDSGEPEKYPYGEMLFHYRWVILDGRWTVQQIKADAKHPTNRLYDVRMNPPDGVEPTDLDINI